LQKLKIDHKVNRPGSTNLLGDNPKTHCDAGMGDEQTLAGSGSRSAPERTGGESEDTGGDEETGECKLFWKIGMCR